MLTPDRGKQKNVQQQIDEIGILVKFSNRLQRTPSEFFNLENVHVGN